MVLCEKCKAELPPKEEYPAICSDCGKACTVPFKPREGWDIYCRDCYAKRRR